MGTKLVIPNADFSANQVPVCMIKTVSANQSVTLYGDITKISDENCIIMFLSEDVPVPENNLARFFGPTGVYSSVTTVEEVKLVGYSCSTLQQMFYQMPNVKKIDLSNIKMVDGAIPCGAFAQETDKLDELILPSKEFKVSSMRGFVNKSSAGAGYSSNFTTLDLSMIDVSECNDFTGCFSNLVKMQVIDLSGWQIGNSADTTSLFYATNNLKKVIVNTKNGRVPTISKLITLLEATHTSHTFTQSTDASGNTVLLRDDYSA